MTRTRRAFATVLIVAVVGVGWCSVTEPRRMAQSILKIEDLPSSARSFDCRSPFTTDVISHCYFEIDPSDLPALLTGWRFAERTRSGSSHREGIAWPDLGEEFEIATEYFAKPPDFEHGGQVTVVTDGSRSKVIVDLYIE